MASLADALNQPQQHIQANVTTGTTGFISPQHVITGERGAAQELEQLEPLAWLDKRVEEITEVAFA